MLGRYRHAPPAPAPARTLGQMPETTPPTFPVVPLIVAWTAVVATAGVIIWLWSPGGRAYFASPAPAPAPAP